MKSTKSEFPNPVLANDRDDYIRSCSFETELDIDNIEVTAESINIPVRYHLVCDGLKKLIENDEAVVLVSVKSSAASYKRLFSFTKDATAQVINIPKFSVIRRMDITGFVVAKCSIHEFSCPGEFNDLYFSNATFDIRKGDVLAQEDTQVIYIDDTELEKPLASIFNINNGHEQEEHILPDFSGEKIEVSLCEALYKQYTDYIEFNNGALRRYVTGIIVYPVLIEAIARICEAHQTGCGDEQHRRWFRAIELKAEKTGIDLSQYFDSYATLANQLLGDISLDALLRLKDVLESEVNSGEVHSIGGVD